MFKQGSSTALILVATGFLMVMTGCETSKHAEVMGNESFAAKEKMAAMQEADSGGIPMGDQGISQSAMSGISPEGPPGATLRGLDRQALTGEDLPTMASGEGMGGEPEIPTTVTPGPPEVPDSFPSGNRGPAAGFGPEDPAMPTFGREESVEPIASLESGFDPGPTGYEGQDLATSTSPSSGIKPINPAYPTIGQEPSDSMGTVVAVPEMAVPETTEPPATPPTVLPMDSGDTQMTPVPLNEIADVFFDFDQYSIRSDAAATLVQNARILQGEHRGSKVLIEGHCDERGTEEYNMVLGERRAQSVKNYLVDLGVPGSNIQIVSYGKERPFCTDHYDACWDQNRRGHFVIQ
jgi:peptidoglycan-associated lipoprotein